LDEVMAEIPMPPSWSGWREPIGISRRAWLVENTLFDSSTGESVRIDVTESDGEGASDGFDRWPDHLRVIHLEFCGNVGILEVINEFLAHRVDLPIRVLTVKWGEPSQGFQQRPMESENLMGQVLLAFAPVHFLISRSRWLELRERRSRRPEVSSTQPEAA
jgi:hypothetical protein